MIRLGVLADDLTGATDMASSLEAGGLRVRIVVGVPESLPGECDAVVVALKIRSAEESEAVRIALASAEVLRGHGAERLFFKYSSTFDSAETGNIGPVADALADFCAQRVVVVTPSFPRLGRTLYQGNLFVGSELLERSGLGEHPLTPRRRSSIVELMSRQTTRPVGLIPLQKVHQGPEAVIAELEDLERTGYRYAVVDGVEDLDLEVLARAVVDHAFVTGSAGLGGALANVLGPIRRDSEAWVPPGNGYPVMLCGSCSVPTKRQVETYSLRGPTLRIDHEILESGDFSGVLAWVSEHVALGAPLVYSTPGLGEQDALVSGEAAQFEAFFARLAGELRGAGFRRFVVAGGETSGAVVQGMGLKNLDLGPEICPGVPWMDDGAGVLIALKSGNYGEDDFFIRASVPDTASA